MPNTGPPAATSAAPLTVLSLMFSVAAGGGVEEIDPNAAVSVSLRDGDVVARHVDRLAGAVKPLLVVKS